jgi:hypothetical protein
MKKAKRKRHSGAFKAKVGLEALRGIKTALERRKKSAPVKERIFQLVP